MASSLVPTYGYSNRPGEVPGESHGVLAWLRDKVGGWFGPTLSKQAPAAEYLRSGKVAAGPKGIALPWFLPYDEAQSGTGETQQMRLAYRRMWSDAQVSAALRTQIFGVAAQQLQIHAADKRNKYDQHNADLVRWNLTKRLTGGLTGFAWNVLSGALTDGYSINEKVWGYNQTGKYAGKIALAALKQKDVGNTVVLKVDGFRNIISVMGLQYNAGEEFPPSNFVIYSHMKMYERPTGLSALRCIYRPWWLMDTAQKLRKLGAETRAFPLLIGTYEDASQQPSLNDALEQAKATMWMSLPASMKAEALSIAGSADEIFKGMIADLREEIFLGITLATLQSLTGGQDVARGSSQVHQDSANLGKWFLSEVIMNLLNDQETGLIKDIVDLNEVCSEYPYASLSAVDPQELKTEADIVSVAVKDWSLPISKEWAYEKFALEAPHTDLPDDELKAPAPPTPPGMGGMPPGMPGGGGDSPPGGKPPPPNGNGPTKPAASTKPEAFAEDASGHEHKGSGPGGGQFTGSGGGGGGKSPEKQKAKEEKTAAKAKNRQMRQHVEKIADDSPADIVGNLSPHFDNVARERLMDLSTTADAALANPKRTLAEKATAYDQVAMHCRKIAARLKTNLTGVDMSKAAPGSVESQMANMLSICREAATAAEKRATVIRQYKPGVEKHAEAFQFSEEWLAYLNFAEESDVDNPAEHAALIADLLTAIYGDKALDYVNELEGSGGKIHRFAGKWDALQHPRGKGGRFIPKNSPEAHAAAKDAIKKAVAGPKTAESLKAVTEHLGILTTKQLHDLKKEHGLKASGKVKQELIDKIAAKLHAKEPETGTKEPHEMTKEEYVNSMKGQKIEKSAYYNRAGLLDKQHYVAVAHALQLGKPVPRNVWEPYRSRLESDGFRVKLKELDAKHQKETQPPAAKEQPAPAAKEPTVEPLSRPGAVHGAGGLSKVTIDGKPHFFKAASTSESAREVATADLAQMAGVGVPAAKATTVQGKPGVLSDWSDGVPAEKDKAAFHAAVKADPAAASKLAAFHFLVGAEDRHAGNYLVHKGKIDSVDHSDSLPTNRTPQQAADLMGQDDLLAAMEKVQGGPIQFDQKAIGEVASKVGDMAKHLRSKGMGDAAKSLEARGHVLGQLAKETAPTEARLKELASGKSPEKSATPVDKSQSTSGG